MNKIPILAGLVNPRDIRVEDKFDKIFKAYLDRNIDSLPQELKDCVTRWTQVNALLRQGIKVKRGKHKFYKPYNYAELVKFLTATYDISVRTAYEDIKSTKRFFAIEESQEDDDFAKGMFLEKLEEKSALCNHLGDHKAAAAYDKMIMSIRKWDKERDLNLPKYDEMQLPTLDLVTDPSELGFPKMDNPDAAVKRIMAKRKTSKMDSLFADAETVNLMNIDVDAENLAE